MRTRGTLQWCGRPGGEGGAVAPELHDPGRPCDRDQDPAGHGRDQQRYAQGELTGGAEVVHGDAVLVLQDEDDEQDQQHQRRTDGDPDHSGPCHRRPGPVCGR